VAVEAALISMPRDPAIQAAQRRQRVLAALSDGEFYSLAKLAKRTRIPRTSLGKIVESLRELGIEIQAEAGEGIRLPRAVDLYDKGTLLEAMSLAVRSSLVRTDVLLSVDSTNRFVADIDESLLPGDAQLCLAELQNAGRGRRGRSWLAPFGSGICMSVGWQFAVPPPAFSALSLAVGVATVTALRQIGAQDVQLKWPNDLLWNGRKLGGILIEMRGESTGPAHVIIGIGINIHMPASVRLTLAEQQAALIADVHEILRDRMPTRNIIIAAIMSELVPMLRTFADHGFEPLRAQWEALDAFANAPVKVISGSQTTSGIERGVADDGSLLVEVDGEVRKFVSGEVSMRGGKAIADRR
jgi:BirA family transcriptional regulator, biotin operon repressor / biotin---[acetyl-CoA-carboxylase] ligase